MDAKTLRKAMKERYDSVTKLISGAKRNLAMLPEGRIKIKHKGPNTYYYYVNNKTEPSGTLAKKEDLFLVRQYAQRAYYQNILKTAEQEQALLGNIIKKYPDVAVEEVYEAMPSDRQDITNPVVPTDEQFLKAWQSKPYKGKAIGEGIPVYETLKGERVRSKSEQIIADRLNVAGIPYKYECPLKVGSKTFHPDFTILRMSDRKEVYYEHFGKMDDPKYVNENMIPRLSDYQQNGIIPGDDLFTTFESSAHPLDTRDLDALIENKFR